VFWRPPTVGDLESALALDPCSFGAEIVGRTDALAAYAHLVGTRRFSAAVIEMPLPHGRRQLVGFGGAVNQITSAPSCITVGASHCQPPKAAGYAMTTGHDIYTGGHGAH